MGHNKTASAQNITMVSVESIKIEKLEIKVDILEKKVEVLIDLINRLTMRG